MIDTAVEQPTVAAQRARPAPLSRGTILIQLVLVLGAILAVTPFAYMLLTSLKSFSSVINNVIWPWPPFGSEPFQFGNYPEAIDTIGWDAQWGMYLFFRYL